MRACPRPTDFLKRIQETLRSTDTRPARLVSGKIPLAFCRGGKAALAPTLQALVGLASPVVRLGLGRTTCERGVNEPLAVSSQVETDGSET